MEKEQLEQICRKLTEMDATIRTYGHPAHHPLQGLHLLQADPEKLTELKTLLKALQGQLYQYTALLLFAAEKPELSVPAITWLPDWNPNASLTEEPVYQSILKPIRFNWSLADKEFFLFKYFAKKKYLKKWEEGCSAHIRNMEDTYAAIQELARLSLPETDAATEFPRNLTRWSIYLESRGKDWYPWCQLRQELEALQRHDLVDCFISQQKTGSEIAQMLHE